MSKYCLGCGVLLQAKEEKKEGYVSDISQNYCKRCFRMTHYHELSVVGESKSKDVLAKINASSGFAFFFCDFLNLYPENIKYYHQITLPKVFVVTKKDTIPKSIYYLKVKEWLQKDFKIKEDIFFVNEKSVFKIKDLLENIPYQNIYFTGPTNAGKSSLLNTLLKEENKKDLLTISEARNTTLNFIKVSYKNKTLYDTVGFIDELPYMTLDLQKKSNLKKEIKPLSLPMKKNSFCMLEDFLFLEMNHEENIIWFGSENLKVSKTYKKPSEENKVKKEIKIVEPTNLYIKGLGFFYIKESTTLILYLENHECLSMAPSFFKR